MRHLSPGLLLLAFASFAQAERLPIRGYTTSDGLRSEFVQRIARDSRGFLWFGTRDGLSRFDGREFVTYTMDHGLPNPTVNDLLETRDGQYWVATNGGGVCRFWPEGDPGQEGALFTTYLVGPTTAGNRVNRLLEDRKGRIWATTDDGVFFLERTADGVTVREIDLQLPSFAKNKAASLLLEDREGHLWFGAGSGCLIRLLPDGRLVRYTLENEPLHHAQAVLEDREGFLWVGYGRRLYQLRPRPVDPWPEHAVVTQADFRDAGEKIRTLPHKASAVHQTRDGRFWIATPEGLIELDGTGSRRYTTAHGLTVTPVRSMAEDRDGNLWLGTSSAGAMKLTLNGFRTYGESDGLGSASNLRVHSIFEDGSRRTIVVTVGWHINRFDGSKFIAVRPDLAGGIGAAWTSNGVLLDSDQRWWMAADESVLSFPRTTFEDLGRVSPYATYTQKHGLAGGQVLRMFEDANRDIWISNNGIGEAGVARWERMTGTVHGYSVADGLPPTNAPSAFCHDRSGALWLGFYDGGLARHVDGRFTVYTVADGLPSGGIHDLQLDGAGRLWIASTQGGVARLDHPDADDRRFVRYTTAEGLASNNVRALTADGWGRIWAGTVRGVDRIDPHTGHIRHYTTGDGLASSFVTSAFKDSRGWLWFGTLHGVSRLIPEPDAPEPPQPVWISGLRIAGTPHPVSELGQVELAPMTLGPRENRLRVDFFGLGFAIGQGLRYQHKLEASDDDWTAPSEQRSVTFANLAPGHYRFLVRAVNASGLTSTTPAGFSFTILPPVWQRWWFFSLAAMFAAAAIYGLYRYRVRQLLAVERVRLRIARDLHDDLGSTLSSISIQSEVARRKVRTDAGKTETLISQVGASARELADATADIVWSVDPRRDDLASLVARVRAFAAELFEETEIRCTVDAPGDPESVSLRPEIRRQFYLIVKEALNNAARHSDASTVAVTIEKRGTVVEGRISDDGRGFDPDAAVSREGSLGGHGLSNMRSRAEQFEGELTIDSSPAGGSSLTVRIPL